MKFDFDILCIGLGPAGMAVTIMASEMGLKVCAIEKNKIGGECMNVGCIPSKGLLAIAKARTIVDKFPLMELSAQKQPEVKNPFKRIQKDIAFINEKKTVKMFDKVKLILNQGHAEFINKNTVKVGTQIISAKRIFIATGTEPMVPPIPGLKDVPFLTNNTIFSLEKIPESMVILGGGAIGCEMAQAFSKLGCKCSIVQMGEHLLPLGDKEAGDTLEQTFTSQGITVLNNKKIIKIEKTDTQIIVSTEDGIQIKAEKLLAATGRKIDLSSLKLENAGIKFSQKGIQVNNFLQTSSKNIFAVGDCNGHHLFSHAAMHQGMLALMNALMPLKQNFKKYIVPWTVFTEPQISYAGKNEAELIRRKIKYETIKVKYEDYGAAIAESVETGFLKAFISPTGKIYGISIAGEGSGEMINEWALAIQNKINIVKIMMLQHSFPTMGFLSKRVAETWMMKKMQLSWVKKICKLFA